MDLYDLLGLGRGATLIEIKRSYKRLARKYHPDINPGDHAAESRFKEITRAYETLSDPERRVRYDAGDAALGPSTVTFEFEGFDFSAETSDSTTFGDLFAEVFTRRTGAGSSPTRGADLHAEISLGFDEALRGAQRQLTVTRQDVCRSCGGVGVLKIAESPCTRCQGAGTLRSRRGSLVFSKSCEACGGTGRLEQTTCGGCRGSGLEIRTEGLSVRVPAGVSDQSRVRVPGKGNAGLAGGRPGDLLLTVRVEPHEGFRREGDDFHSIVPIGVHEAALGARIDVPTPEGPATLRVPPGTQSGQRFRLRGKGAPSPRGAERGDLVVEVRIALPKVLDERSKELLREFGRINGERS